MKARLEAEKLGFWKRVKNKIVAWWRKFVNFIKRMFGKLKKDGASLSAEDYEKSGHKSKYPIADERQLNKLLVKYRVVLKTMLNAVRKEVESGEEADPESLPESQENESLIDQIEKLVDSPGEEELSGAALHRAVERAKKSAAIFSKHAETSFKYLNDVESLMKRAKVDDDMSPEMVNAMISMLLKAMSSGATSAGKAATKLTKWVDQVQGAVGGKKE